MNMPLVIGWSYGEPVSSLREASMVHQPSFHTACALTSPRSPSKALSYTTEGSTVPTGMAASAAGV